MSHRFLVVIAAALLAAGVARSHAQGDTAVTYQGVLGFMGQPYTGTADYLFSLWDAPVLGAQVGGTQAVLGVAVDAGLFTARLDFGADAYAAPRWLLVEVRTPAWDGTGMKPNFTPLEERQLLTRSPYSIQTRGIFVDDEEMVGVGTQNPHTRLHVSGAENEGLTAVLKITSDIQNMLLDGNEIDSDAPNGLYLNNNTPHNVVLAAGGGRVGVGLSAPGSSLQVNGGVRARGGPPGANGISDNGYAFAGSDGDTDSGLFSLADGEVSLFTDAIERFRFSQAGLRFPDGSTQATAAPPGLHAVAVSGLTSFQFNTFSPGERRVVSTAGMTGALPGDRVIITPGLDLPPPLIFHGAYVPEPGVVRFMITNITLFSYSPPPISWSLLVVRP